VTLTDRQLASNIERIASSAAAVRGHRFTVGGHGTLPDFNAECDRRACEVILDTESPLR
jgi:hypothetical protein